MHPDKHQFPDDPRDTHENEWTPEGLEEFKHWTEAENAKKENAARKANMDDKPPF